MGAAIDALRRNRPDRRRPGRLTREEILAAIRRWNDLYGEPPTMADWDPYRARYLGQEWRVERYDEAPWPSAKSVRNHFGRLSDAVAAAGFVPRRQGQRRADHNLALDEDVMLHLAHLRLVERGEAPTTRVAAALRDLTAARRSSEPGDLRASLVELAAAALAWAGMVDAPADSPFDPSAL